MGSRYDAPGTREQAIEEQPTREQDLWQALDEGRDPTDTNARVAPAEWRDRAPLH